MQFAPEVEERFRRIEDAHAVTAELLRRFELETKERAGHAERIQDAMARWVEQIALQVSTLAGAQLRNEETMRRLEETVDRFLQSRSNGGAGN
jgi:hypothetical protein